MFIANYGFKHLVQKAAMVAKIPMGRKGLPEDLANLIRFVVGPNATYISGETIHCNGGAYMNALSNDHLVKVIREGGPAVGKSPLMAPWGGVIDDQGEHIIGAGRDGPLALGDASVDRQPIPRTQGITREHDAVLVVGEGLSLAVIASPAIGPG